MISKHGEIFKFNIFSATLGASRLHIFLYSKFKTRIDVQRCLIQTFEYIGGITKEILTDNMSSIVNTKTGCFVKEFVSFTKDLTTIPKSCKPKHPYTKGKDESANRFMSWLIPYNHEFEDEEDLIRIIKEINKADNRNTFSINRKDKTEFDVTQFGTVCKQLDILLDTSSNPTSKANVERENRTFKNRLIPELRHNNITDIDSANEYLNKIFIPKMNKKFSYDIIEETSKIRRNDYTEADLNLSISEKFTRIIDNASSISFNSNYYVPVDVETGEIITYKHKTECTVIIAYDSTYWCKIENSYYRLHKLDKRPPIVKNTKQEKKKIQKYTNMYHQLIILGEKI